MSTMNDFFKEKKIGMTPIEASKSERSRPTGVVEKRYTKIIMISVLQ